MLDQHHRVPRYYACTSNENVPFTNGDSIADASNINQSRRSLSIRRDGRVV